MKRKTIIRKQKARDEKKKQPEKGKIKDIASALIMCIDDGYITYRQFKEIQAIIDIKYWKPSWVREKCLSNQ